MDGTYLQDWTLYSQFLGHCGVDGAKLWSIDSQEN